jgi:hypothetical protein
MTTPITTLPITGYTITDLALVAPAAGQFLEVGGSSDGRIDIDALATYCRTGVTWGSISGKPTTLEGFGITDAQPLNTNLTDIAALTTTGYGRGMLTLADAAAALAYIGAAPTSHTQAWSTITSVPANITTVSGWTADQITRAGAIPAATSGTLEKTGATTYGTYTVSTYGKSLIDDANAAAARTTLGATTVGSNLFTLTNPSAITFPRVNPDNTISALSAADFRTAIGAQPLDSDLTTIAALTPNDGNFIVGNGTDWVTESGATVRDSLGIPALGNWTTLSLTFGAEFDPVLVGSHPTRVRVNEFLRLVIVEFCVGAASVPTDSSTIFSWTSAYALPSSPTLKVATIDYANITPYPLVVVEGNAIKFNQRDLAPSSPISALLGQVLFIY